MKKNPSPDRTLPNQGKQPPILVLAFGTMSPALVGAGPGSLVLSPRPSGRTTANRRGAIARRRRAGRRVNAEDERENFVIRVEVWQS